MTSEQTTFGPRGLALPAEGEARHGALCLAPGVRLARGRMHEVMGESADIFALAAAACAGGPVVWIAPQRDVASSGLETVAFKLCAIPEPPISHLGTSEFVRFCPNWPK